MKKIKDDNTMKRLLCSVCIALMITMSAVVLNFIATSCSKDGGGGGSDGVSEGKGGSMARFAIKGNYLYTVSRDSLKIFDITDAANPRYSPSRDICAGFDIETVFPMGTLLFIGARSGMYVYDISEPRFPTLLSQVSHITSCDPVVAQGDYAYVTLNTNTTGCGRNINNVLNIYNVSQPLRPELKRTVQMKGPTGLGVDGTKLFVCDYGLKIFDISDPLNIRQTGDLLDIEEADEIRAAYDVIPYNGLLILVAKEGLFQFDYSGDNLEYVSKIVIQKR
jgi:hypothetical protein